MCFPEKGVIDLPSRQINDFLQKMKQKKIELVARPVDGSCGCFECKGPGWALKTEKKIRF